MVRRVVEATDEREIDSAFLGVELEAPRQGVLLVAREPEQTELVKFLHRTSIDRLQRITLLLQQPPDGVVADLEPLRAKRIGELAGGLARPPQRRLRIPASVRVDQLIQCPQQTRLALDQPLWPAARTAHAAVRIRLLVQLPHACVHRRT